LILTPRNRHRAKRPKTISTTPISWPVTASPIRIGSQDTLRVIEIQSGDYLGEDDIERFDDIYGRTDD